MSTNLTEEQARIHDKVRKLLALGENAGATEGERDNAMRMAYKLLAKHNIDLADVKGKADDVEPRAEQYVEDMEYPYVKDIYQLIGGLFFCEYFFRSGHRAKKAWHHFVGRTSNAVTACELAQHIVKGLFKEMRQRYGSTSTAETRAFAVGVVSKLRQRVRAIKAEAQEEVRVESSERALVLLNMDAAEKTANEAWIQMQGFKIKLVKDRQAGISGAEASAYHAGVKHGSTISLNASIGNKPAAPRLK